MSRHNHVGGEARLAPGLDEEQGVHYHYHYYGNTRGDLGTRPTAREAAPVEGGAVSGPVNLHRHPAADSLVKGLVVGAGVAYLLTNEHAQRTLLRTATQVWSGLASSIEEWKERLRDIQAEASSKPPENENPTG